MFVLVFLVLLASSTAQSGIPQYYQGRWIITEENPQYDNTDGQSLAVVERMWPKSPPEILEVVTVEDSDLPTTPEPYIMKEQDSDEVEDSTVWKIVLVVSILLVSIVGSLSTAYYMCVWRGGRIHYKPQKQDHA
ncbi:hypothetical protein ABVT39_024851 [Epinephelus coioides]